MSRQILLAHGYVVTMNAKFECIEDGAVLIDNDRIAAVGPTALLMKRLEGHTYDALDCSGKMILPGLIDAHTHAGHCLNRSLGLDSRTRWMDYLTKIYHHSTTPAYWYAEGRLAALERLKARITCGVSVISNAARCDDPRIVVEHVRGHAEVGTRENPAIGPSNPPYPRAFGVEENGRIVEKNFTFDELMDKAEEAIELVNGSFGGLIGAFAAPFVMVGSIEGSKPTPADLACRLTDYDRHMMKSIREVARRQNVRIHTEAFGGMIRLAAQADDPLLGPDVHVQHCKGISFKEAMILAETKTNVTTTPAWHQLQIRCPVPELIELGANVAVTTDGTAPAMPFDLFRAARDTALLQQAALNDPFILPAGKILSMITIDAARAIGREHDLGSLEVGKLADITTVKVASPHLSPQLMPIHQLMLFGNPGDVSDVFVAGRLLMRNRTVLTVSEADVLESAERASLEAIERAGAKHLLKPSDNFWTGAQSRLDTLREP